MSKVVPIFSESQEEAEVLARMIRALTVSAKLRLAADFFEQGKFDLALAVARSADVGLLSAAVGAELATAVAR